MRTIVIGVGNPVRADDAVGLHVARKIREKISGQDIADVEELWAGGLRLAEAMSGYDRAFIIDAMITGDCPAGEVRLLTLSELSKCRSITCIHDATLSEALGFFRQVGELVPEDIRIYGVEAKDVLTLSESLTEPVANAVTNVVESVLRDISQF